MTDRLSLYSGALLELKERTLTSLTEERPARRYLDEAWNNGAVDEMLNEGQWTFATRSVQLVPSTSLEPLFGYQNIYEKPADHVRTTALCCDERFNVPEQNYQIEGGNFLSDTNPLYLSYVSNDAAYGADLSRWPPDVAAYAKLFLADKIIGKLTGNKTDRDALQKMMRKKLVSARSSDTMERPPAFPAMGTWARSRLGRRGGYDRGSTSRLIG